MMLQEQLAQPQTAPVLSFADFPVFDSGLLGNKSSQAPRIWGAENFSEPAHALQPETLTPIDKY